MELGNGALLRRGTAVTLETINGDRVIRQAFVIEAVTNDRLELCAQGWRLSGPLPSPGSRVRGFIVTPIRAYQFESTVLANSEKIVPTVILALPKALVPVQRRQSFRLQVLHTVLLNDPDGRWQKKATGLDISARGVRLHLKRRAGEIDLPFSLHSPLHLQITLPPVKPKVPRGLQVNASGEAVWARKDQWGWWIGVAFTDIERKARERLIAWCFAFQRFLLKLGLLSPRKAVEGEERTFRW